MDKCPHSNPVPAISSIPSESLLSILLTYELGALLYISVKNSRYLLFHGRYGRT